MKYAIFNDIEFDYDDLIKNEIYLYEIPDNFIFDINLLINFMKYKNINYKVLEEYTSSVVSLNKDDKPTGRYYTIDWLMHKNTYCKKDNIEKEEFVEWIKTLGVKEIKFEYIQ
jgi:hypothetical protein